MSRHKWPTRSIVGGRLLPGCSAWSLTTNLSLQPEYVCNVTKFVPQKALSSTSSGKVDLCNENCSTPSGRAALACMCSGSETGSYLRLIDSCITQLKAQGPSRTCNESKEEEEVSPGRSGWRGASQYALDSVYVYVVGNSDHGTTYTYTASRVD